MKGTLTIRIDKGIKAAFLSAEKFLHQDAFFQAYAMPSRDFPSFVFKVSHRRFHFLSR